MVVLPFGAGALVSCTTATGSNLAWSFSFANDDTAAQAERVEVTILRGGCTSGEEVYRAEVTRGGDAPVPPRLSAGTYALAGRAVSSDCRELAYGCVQVQLPASDGAQFQVVLDDSPDRPVCTGSCGDRCGPDAGTPSEGDGGPVGDGDDGDGDGTGDGDVDASDGGDAGEGGDGDGPRDAGLADGSVDSGPPDPCLDGKSRPGGQCYRFVSQQALSFADAEADCVTWGGHLVSFNDADEELWVSTEAIELGTFGSPARYWIGFTDSETETLWTWTDGSTNGEYAIVTYDVEDPESLRFKVLDFNDVYTHWGPNLPAVGNSEPNNGNKTNPAGQNPGEDCAESNSARLNSPGGVDPRPSWDDRNCEDLKFYVCER